MKILCAPDSFKGSLTATDAAQAMAQGIADADDHATCDLCPIADGGEGTVETLLAATAGQRVVSRITGPLGEPVDAAWGYFEQNRRRIAVIELAAAAGLPLVSASRRDPTATTTFGVGELIRLALDRQVNEILLGIGGSATNDAACGAAQALGVMFFNAAGQRINVPMNGSRLAEVSRMDVHHMDPRLRKVQLSIACDVTNPLFGPNGAAHVYAPQKGASPQQVQQLDKNLRQIADIWQHTCDTSKDIATRAGGGAAGGFGAGAVAMLGASLRRGIEQILDAVDFDSRVRKADLCFTGEGKLDAQTQSGKAIAGVVQRARAAQTPVHAFAGRIDADPEALQAMGLTSWHAISDGQDEQTAMAHAGEHLRNTVSRFMQDTVL